MPYLSIIFFFEIFAKTLKFIAYDGPILKSAMVVCKSVEELVDVLTELDGYRETFFSLIVVVLQEFQRSTFESLQSLIHAEDDNIKITSTSLVNDKGMIDIRVRKKTTVGFQLMLPFFVN